MNSIHDNIQFLKGVGDKRALQLNKIGIFSMLDLMEFFPRDYIDRKASSKIGELEIGVHSSFIGEIVSIEIRKYGIGKSQLNVMLTDGLEFMLCTWFRYGNWFTKQFKNHQQIWVSGLVTKFQHMKQIVHPEIEILEESEDTKDFWHSRPILPVYRLTGTITMKMMRKFVFQVFALYHDQIEENLPEIILQHYSFKNRKTALQLMHFSTIPAEIPSVRTRFVFEELFYHQLMLFRMKEKHQTFINGVEFKLYKTYTTRLKNALPFELTSAQKKVIHEIVQDMTKPIPMNRLLQGDVGSGKTIVVIFAMLIAVENEYQAILMAPTELLAEQHFQTLQNFLRYEESLKIELLKGGNYKGKSIQKDNIKSGEASIIIGTHALLQKDVEFKQVGLVVIDEQHRFGVEQRAILSQNNNRPDVLHLSATPIPRSLALTVYGDMNISIIDELPPNRKSILTKWISANKKDELWEKIRIILNQKKQVYVVCPLIEESEKMDLLDAERMYQELQEFVFSDFHLSILHGRMKTVEKDSIMKLFVAGKIDVLISTTVIEVGIDVPNATVMVIEHAERFGLSQLHQLRGRIGRGADQSYCYLVVHQPVGNIAKERLQCMVDTNDGFKVAEKDLEIRGPGDFFGTNQSGMPNFKFANIVRDQKVLLDAREIAEIIIKEDQGFEKEKYKTIRNHYKKFYKNREKWFEF